MLDLGLTPGGVCDFYLARRRYDDEQHGLKREVKKNDPAKAGLE